MMTFPVFPRRFSPSSFVLCCAANLILLMPLCAAAETPAQPSPAVSAPSASTSAGFSMMEVWNFFHQYQTFNDEMKIELLQLYAPNAVMTVESMMPDGDVKTTDIKMDYYRALVVNAIVAKAAQPPAPKKEKPTFDQVKITPVEGGAMINARRYDESKCYYDTSYAMRLKKGADGTYKIIREHMTVLAESACRNP